MVERAPPPDELRSPLIDAGRPELSRRDLLLGGATLLAALTHSERGEAETPTSDLLDAHDLQLPGDARIARRALVLTPRPLPAHPLPVLVLLHGLGETGNELLGIHAWGERYGLVTSYERLKRAPVARTLQKLRYLTDSRVTELNQSLQRRPFRDLILVCPVTPNPYKLQPAPQTLDRYADWIEQTLLPTVRKRFPASPHSLHTGLDGCSLGGYVGIEVFLRKPELFTSYGGVQSAYGVAQAGIYAERIAQAIQSYGPKALHFESSSQDPYLEPTRAISKRLTELDVPHVLREAPGPHNQPWLREIGTLEMLLWHSRQLELRPSSS
ncbi:MAG: alpha/beta hydrolase-fold protein [Polyangiaceae bacterium]